MRIHRYFYIDTLNDPLPGWLRNRDTVILMQRRDEGKLVVLKTCPDCDEITHVLGWGSRLCKCCVIEP